MAGGSGCRSESWLAVTLGLKLKRGWELEWKLESELELKLQPERELEWELELMPLKLDKYGGHPQNPDLGPKWQYLAIYKVKTTLWGRFWGYISKTENVPFPRTTQLYNSRFSFGVSHKKCICKEP